jgi:hypothetical protein
MHDIELKTVQSSEMTHTATADGTSSSNTQTLDLHKKIYRFNFGREPHLKKGHGQKFHPDKPSRGRGGKVLCH